MVMVSVVSSGGGMCFHFRGKRKPFETVDGYEHAFLYSGGSMRDLGTLGGPYILAFGVNDGAQVVGTAVTGGGAYHGFLYSGATMADLHTLGGTRSDAFGINNSGQIV